MWATTDSQCRQIKRGVTWALLGLLKFSHAAAFWIIYRGYRGKFSKIVIHVDTNDVRLRQSEITKNNVKEVCELASMMSDTVICSGPLPAYWGDEIHSRLSSLNGWMSKWCPQNNIGFIYNWTSFGGRPDLLKRDGLPPSWGGGALLSRNMAHSLRLCTWLTGAQVRKLTDWLNRPSASHLTSQKSVNSQHIVQNGGARRRGIFSPDRTVFSCFLSCKSQCFCTVVSFCSMSAESHF